jgi:hypothetical protein
MKKKRTLKSNTKKSTKAAQQPTGEGYPTAPGDADKPPEFDFGGLPSRELKKNLGCG